MKILDHFDQGTPEWLAQRIGKVTASRFKEAATNGRGNAPSVTRQKYINELVAEILSGQPTGSYVNADMARGTFLEPFARQAFTLATDIEVQQVGFVLHTDERIGGSPDGLTESSGVEIKCPRPNQHIRVLQGQSDDDYMHQIQGCMWLCERDCWFLVSYCPWVTQQPLAIRIIKRDDAMIKKIDQAATEVADEVQSTVASVLMNKLPQPLLDHAAASIRAYESAIADSAEVVL